MTPSVRARKRNGLNTLWTMPLSHWGLEVSARQAGRCYGIIVISMLVALGLGITRINPIKALFYSAVINGVVAVPLIVLILLLSART